jgi:small redox-active disulfide protein 2
MIIKVLGSGCANCKKVKLLAADVAKELGVEATIQEVTDLSSIMNYGVMSTPGVVINEQLVGSGRVPTKEQMQQFIKQAMA